jgi:TolA-binding protein
LAYDQKDWAWAEELFDMVVKLGAKTAQFRLALSGLAWTEYHAGKSLEAASDFGRLAEEFAGDSKQKAEALYMQGRALEDGGDLSAAAKVYQTTFETFAPKQPAKSGDEETDPLRFAFLAGIQAARTRTALKEPEVADVAYEVVLTKFPKVKDLDKLLDEWALMNLKAERFERSDQVFQMLIEKVPESPLVDNARLSLAESEFVGGKLLDAKKSFQELAASPNSDAEVKERAMFQLIEILTEQRAWDQIATQAETFLKSFETSPYRDTVSFRRAEAMTSLEKFAEAEPVLKQLTQAKADSDTAKARWFPRAWVLLAECLVRQQKYPEVEATVTAFREAYPKSDKLHEAEEVLGRAYKNQAKWEDARAAFERSLAQPAAKGTETAAKSQLMIAETYWNQKNYKSAQEQYLKVYYNHTGYPDWQAPALFQAAMCDEKLGDAAQAKKTYAEVIEKFPKSKYAEPARERWAAIQDEAPKSAG